MCRKNSFRSYILPRSVGLEPQSPVATTCYTMGSAILDCLAACICPQTARPLVGSAAVAATWAAPMVQVANFPIFLMQYLCTGTSKAFVWGQGTVINARDQGALTRAENPRAGQEFLHVGLCCPLDGPRISVDFLGLVMVSWKTCLG